MNRAKRSPGSRRAPRPWVIFALASLASTALQACVRKPEVKLHHAAVRGATMYGLGMDVFLIINNTNSYDVQVRNVRATVTLARQYAVPLQFSPNTVLPSGRSVVLAVPMMVPWAVVPGLVAASAGSPTVPYTVRGNADVTALGFVDRDEYPVDEAGTIPRQAFVDAARSVMPLRF
ncbi:MAG TPA: hypothetical protein VFS43_34445 [Polyangiaceae bacterium]|nr:hypothetical protein [Polyangiaceae bacterium]